MNEKLISGYTAYTTAEEYSVAATGNAPASAETVSIFLASVAISIQSVVDHC